jgi:hypothetical protein
LDGEEVIQVGNESDKKVWSEEIIVKAEELVEKVKELIIAGNVRRIIIRNANNDVLMEIPLTAGVAVGGALTIFTPVLVALGAMAALLADIKVEIIRTE